MEYQKGHHVLIEAINYIKNNIDVDDIKILIIGTPSDDDYLEQLKATIKSNNLFPMIVFIDKVSHDFIPNILQDLNIVVFTACLPDAFPRSIIESMAMKKKIIASRIGGVSEQISEGINGFLFEPSDYKALGDKIMYVKKNYKELNRIGESARNKVVDRWSDEAFQSRFTNKYMELLI